MEDFKEIFYFSVSLILAAFIISFITFLGTTARQAADIRNNEIWAAENIRTAGKYAAYDNKTITGADVIALLRENARNGELQIYVDKNRNNVSLIMMESNYTASTWKLSNLLQSIDGGAAYTAILVYGYDSPSSASHIASSNSMVTGIKLTRS